MDAGIKVIAFVQPLEEYDAGMRADNTLLANAENHLATLWVNETFPDAADGTIPCAVLTSEATDVNVAQSEILLNIAEFCPKVKVVATYDITDETVESGVTAAETLYTTNPEIQLFLSTQSAVSLGVNNYFTSMSSPVTDYSEMGIFTANGGDEILTLIKESITDESPFRGTILAGGIQISVDDMVSIVYGVLDGSIAKGEDKYAKLLFINADTIDEFNETGNVQSILSEDFE